MAVQSKRSGARVEGLREYGIILLIVFVIGAVVWSFLFQPSIDALQRAARNGQKAEVLAISTFATHVGSKTEDVQIVSKANDQAGQHFFYELSVGENTSVVKCTVKNQETPQCDLYGESSPR